MKSTKNKQPEMDQIDLTKPALPLWYPDITRLRQQMLEYMRVPEDRLNINFEEIK